MKKVVLFGDKSFARMAHFYLTNDSPYEVAAFTIDRKYIKQNELNGLPVVPFEDIATLYPPSDYAMMITVLASRVNRLRAERYDAAKAMGHELITYISSKAITWPDLVIGDNCFIGELTLCRPFVKIGNNVIILGNGMIGHDCVVHDHCFIAAGASILGAAVLGEYSVLGAHSVVSGLVSVARECVIGAGCVITANTKEKEVYRTNPPVILPQSSEKLANILFNRFE